ncbi:hypothetical protein [Ferroplasma sp.]|uniref:hypothetical protein n=1 Tax=Ferroplasma sp. TaxID=2591003 RepID=UPI0026062EA0|nr:hypothetical protein [Ferroplasma sp.]MCL4453714.1 hypothetical protein [Candidatus Thermoplasmatota archaeon]
MTFKNPDEHELEIIEYILRLGNAIPQRKIQIKCKHKKIDFENFMSEWKPLIEYRLSRSEKLITINDIDTARRILKRNGRQLISHHSQRSRRY